MATSSVLKRIRTFNANRNPVLLADKFTAMRESSFRFFRGTSHLFNGDIPDDSFIWKSPLTWNVGDLHIENFGSFKADNRVAYFDLNDFDECILGPNLADLARLTCSLFVAADLLKLTHAQTNHLVETLVQTYSNTLAHGYVRFLERETAIGLIRRLLQSVKDRKRWAFLASRVVYRKQKIRLSKHHQHIRKADKATKERISKAIYDWAETRPDPTFFRVLDVARRVAGTGSLGIERFIILVTGPGKLGKEYLLDLKQALPSTLQPRVTQNQPLWTSEAERIVEVRKRIQAASPALLFPLVLPDGEPYVLRELQPTEDKIALSDLVGQVQKLESLVSSIGCLCAWGNLRSSGRQGSAIADELIEFGRDSKSWKQPLIAYAHQYAQQVKADYKAYAQAYDDGFFRTIT